MREFFDLAIGGQKHGMPQSNDHHGRIGRHKSRLGLFGTIIEHLGHYKHHLAPTLLGKEDFCLRIQVRVSGTVAFSNQGMSDGAIEAGIDLGGLGDYRI